MRLRVFSVFILIWGILVSNAFSQPFWERASSGLVAVKASVQFTANGSLLASTDQGLFRFESGGESWKLVEGSLTDAKLDVSASPALYAVAGYRLYRSDDDGRTWRLSLPVYGIRDVAVTRNGRLLVVLPGGGVYEVPPGAQKQDDLIQVYASPLPFIGKIHAAPDGMLYYANSVLHRSADSGVTWTIITRSSPLTAFAIDSSGTVLMGNGEGLLRSTNRGVSWTICDEMIPERIVVSPRGDILTVGAYPHWPRRLVREVRRSTDMGTTWARVHAVGNAVPDSAPAIGPNGEIVMEMGGIIYRTDDFGTNWKPIMDGIDGAATQEIASLPSGMLAVRATASTYFLADSAEQRSWLFRSTDAGESWQRLLVPGTMALRGIGQSLYGQSIKGVDSIDCITWNSHLWRSTDGGVGWELLTRIASPDAYDERDGIVITASVPYACPNTDTSMVDVVDTSGLVSYSSQFSRRVSLVRISNAGAIYLGFSHWRTGGANKFYISRDSGRMWSVAIGNGYVVALAFGPPGTTYAQIGNTGDPWPGVSFFYRSTDDGINWTRPQDSIRARSLQVGADGSLYAIHRALHIDSIDYVLRSTDQGESWLPLFSSSPDTRIDTLLLLRNGGMYVTMAGVVFRSLDSGGSWQRLDDGLNGAKVVALALGKNGRLFATTSSRGVFRTREQISTADHQPEYVAGSATVAPNPCNGYGQLRLTLDGSAHVRVEVFDLLANLVATPLDGRLGPGDHVLPFDVSGTRSGPVSGLYYCRVITNGKLTSFPLAVIAD